MMRQIERNMTEMENSSCNYTTMKRNVDEEYMYTQSSFITFPQPPLIMFAQFRKEQ